MNSTGTAVSTPQRPPRTNTAVWKSLVLPYQKPSLPRAVWQLCNTLVPYAVIWYLMY